MEIERGVPHSLRRRQKIVAALKLPGPESVDQLETEIEERGVSIQKARHTMLALQKMSLATFHNYNIELGLHLMCMSRLHALYFMLRTSYSMCMYLVLASQEVFIAIYISCPLCSWIAPARQQCHAFS